MDREVFPNVSLGYIIEDIRVNLQAIFCIMMCLGEQLFAKYSKYLTPGTIIERCQLYLTRPQQLKICAKSIYLTQNQTTVAYHQALYFKVSLASRDLVSLNDVCAMRELAAVRGLGQVVLPGLPSPDTSLILPQRLLLTQICIKDTKDKWKNTYV